VVEAAVELMILRQDEAVDDIVCRPAQPHELAAVGELRWRWVQELYGTPDTMLDEFVPRFVAWAREAGSSHRCMVMVRDDVVIGMAVARHNGNTPPGFVPIVALVAGVLYPGAGFTALGNDGLMGLWRQQMTWDVYRDREWEPHEADLAAQAEQMRKVEARVTDFAAAH
jgi:hypothetical protein